MRYAIGIRKGKKLVLYFIKESYLSKAKSIVEKYKRISKENLEKFEWIIIKEVLFDGRLIKLLKKASPDFKRFLEKIYFPQRKTLYHCYSRTKKKLKELYDAKKRIEEKYWSLKDIPLIHKELNKSLYEEDISKIELTLKEISENIFNEEERLKRILNDKKSLDEMLISTIPKSIQLEIIEKTLERALFKYSTKKEIIIINEESSRTFPKVALYEIKNNEYRLIM